jgi:aspartyl-tRNA(Asn)/glutamyl-tRNA(Gln) amidotransferase subunit A
MTCEFAGSGFAEPNPSPVVLRRLGQLLRCVRGSCGSHGPLDTRALVGTGSRVIHSNSSASGDPLFYLSIAEASERYRDGSLTPPELLEAVFARIDETEPVVNSFVLETRDAARAEAAVSAERWQAGNPLSRMDGIPIGIKDIYDTAGVITAGGCYALRARVPAEDSTPVALLKAAGAVSVGKTYTVEFASGGLYNPQYRPEITVNPFNPTRQPGGSSSGTASGVAAGQMLAGTGSCTGGSIRGPASFCNLSGIKPTYGLCSKRGVMPLSKTLDHAGPICWTALDCAIFLDAMKGYDAMDPCSLVAPEPDQDITTLVNSMSGSTPLAGMKLGVIPSMVHGSAPDILARFEAAVAMLETLGATITTCEPLAGFDGYTLAGFDVAQMGIMLTEKATYISELLRERPNEVSALCVDQCTPYLDISAQKYVEWMETRREVEMRFEAALADNGIDAFLTPTTKQTAPEVDSDLKKQAEARKNTLDVYNTGIFNMTHQPAVAVPMGMSEDSMPTSLQVSGALWNDALVLQIAHAFQLATDYHLTRPTI